MPLSLCASFLTICEMIMTCRWNQRLGQQLLNIPWTETLVNTQDCEISHWAGIVFEEEIHYKKNNIPDQGFKI